MPSSKSNSTRPYCSTVILPCAGAGNRLGLETPKELFEILPGTRLIDFSLDHIEAFANKQELTKYEIRVAVVIRPWKREVAEYVSQKLPGITVETVLFNDTYREWPGSVYSASGFFSGYNLVLLPDSCLRLRECDVGCNAEGKTLLELVTVALNKYNVIFGCVPCTEPGVLKNLGAVKTEGDRVTAFQDKPSQHLDRFNGFWGCYGFRKDYGKTLYEFLIQSVHHEPVVLEEQPFYPVGAVPLHSYRDLGTWETINQFQHTAASGGPLFRKKRGKNFCLGP
ncbi:MAG: hypothetical protein GY950_01850 [bacterium]|nr:hypothetical protein [bacterium]